MDAATGRVVTTKADGNGDHNGPVTGQNQHRIDRSQEDPSNSE